MATTTETVSDRRRCAECRGALRGGAVLALNRLWHPDHFVCAHCHQPIAQTFQEESGRAYCAPCFADKFNPACAGCGRKVTETCVVAMQQHWHQGCFVCAECKAPFAGGEFYVVDGRPLDLDCHWGRRLDKHLAAHPHALSASAAGQPKH